MTKIVFTTGSGNQFSGDELSAIRSGTLGAHSSTAFSLSSSEFSIDGTGTGLTYSNGHPSGGTLTGLTLGGEFASVWSGFSVSVATLWQTIAAGDTNGFSSLFFGGNDDLTLPKDGAGDFYGYAGDDVFHLDNLNGPTVIDGGSGNDIVEVSRFIDPGGNSPATLVHEELTNVETLSLGAGYNYMLATTDDLVDAGKTLTIDASGLGAGNTLNFDGSTAQSGQFVIKGGAGNDVLEGGSGNDTFNGGSGSDTVTFFHGGSATVNLSITTAQNIGSGQGSDTFISIENLTGSFGNDTLTGNAGDNVLDGGGGTDVLNGGSGNDTVSFASYNFDVTVNLALTTTQTIDQFEDKITLSSIENVTGSPFDDTMAIGLGGDRSVNGGEGNDAVSFAAATSGVVMHADGTYQSGALTGHLTLTSVEKVVGSNFADTVIASATQNTSFDGASGNDTVSYANATNAVVIDLVHGQESGQWDDPDNNPYPTGTFSSVESAIGSQFDDYIGGADAVGVSSAMDGGAGNDTIEAYTGTATVTGGAGDDVITLHDYAPGDTIDGGTGNDEVLLDISGLSQTIVLGAATLVNVETLSVGAGDGTIITNDATVAAGQVMAVTFGDDLTTEVFSKFSFNGSAETNGSFNIRSAAFSDNIILGAGNDTVTSGLFTTNTIDISRGGDDTLLLGNGDDTIQAGGALTAADRIHAAGGENTLILNGNYSAGVTFGTSTIGGIQTLQLMGGKSYALTTNDANVVALKTMTVDGSTLTLSDSLTFNGAAETDGKFIIMSGAGHNTLTGGAGDDTFVISGTLSATDKIDGGAGTDTLELTANSSRVITLGGANLQHVETIKLEGFSASYKLTVTSDIVEAGHVLTVDAATLRSPFTFNGAAEQHGSFSIVGGEGDNVLIGGAGSDYLKGGSGLNTLIGGTGDDTMFGGGLGTVIYSGATGSIAVNLDVRTAQVIGGGEGHDTLIQVDNVTGSNFADLLTGNSDDNMLIGETGDDVLQGGDGDDTLDGGAGFDTASYTSADFGVHVSLAIATGQDTGENLGIDKLVSIEGLAGSAFSDNLTGNSGNNTFAGGGGNDVITGGGGIDTVTYAGANGATKVDLDLAVAQNIGADQGSDTLSGISNVVGSSFGDTLSGNAGNNSLSGGAGNDVLQGRAGNDKLDGGAGSDTASYADATGAVAVSLAVAVAQNIGNGEGKDTLVSIENLTGSAFGDRLTGNSGDNFLKGGAGRDTLAGGGGHDTFVYTAVSQSTGVQRDTLTDFDFATDMFKLGTVQAIDPKIASGSLASANIDAGLTSAIGVHQLTKHGAVLFTPDSGSLSGHLMLVVDANGVAGYQAGQDYVFDITGAANVSSISTANFG